MASGDGSNLGCVLRIAYSVKKRLLPSHTGSTQPLHQSFLIAHHLSLQRADSLNAVLKLARANFEWGKSTMGPVAQGVHALPPIFHLGSGEVMASFIEIHAAPGAVIGQMRQ